MSRISLLFLYAGALSQGVAGGPVVVNVPASCEDSCTQAIQDGINKCVAIIATSQCTVQLDRLSSYKLYGKDGQGILLNVNLPPAAQLFTFNGCGSELQLQQINGVFGVTGGNGAIFADFQVDMARLPYTYARAVSVNSSGTMFVVEDTARYPPPVQARHMANGLNPTPWVGQVQSVLQYDPVLQRPAKGGVDDYMLPPNQKTLIWLRTSSSPIALQSKTRAPPAMNAFLEGVTNIKVDQDPWYVLRHQVYAFNGISGSSVRGLEVTNVTLWTVPGMGVVCSACTDIRLNKLRIEKRCDAVTFFTSSDQGSSDQGSAREAEVACVPRPMSITADGTHLTSCRGGSVHIDNCLYEGQGDDGINIPSRYWEMRLVAPDRKSAQVWQRGAMQPFIGETGDQLLFYNRSTFESYGLAANVTLAAPGPNAPPGWINFSYPLPVPAGLGDGVWDLVVNLKNQPGSITIRNTTFARNRARGALLKASNVAVQGCVFNQTSGPAIQVVPDAGVHWFEGDVISRGNWTVEDSQVIRCSYGAASNGADFLIASQVPVWQNGTPSSTTGVFPTVGTQHRNVTVRNTLFQPDNGQSAIRGFGISGFAIEGCRVNRVPGSPAATGDFGVSSSCSGVQLEGNTCNGEAACKRFDPSA